MREPYDLKRALQIDDTGSDGIVLALRAAEEDLGLEAALEMCRRGSDDSLISLSAKQLFWRIYISYNSVFMPSLTAPYTIFLICPQTSHMAI